MAFPFIHLCVAYEMLQRNPLPNEKDAAQFMLGSIAPDAIHYRAGFKGAAMSNIGAAKKITHLCPVSPQPWGQVTDNIGWVKQVEAFLLKNPADSFAAGYATHVLTDIHNNSTLWEKFRTNHPSEAAKGYASEYYADMNHIHNRTFYTQPETPAIMALLAKADAFAVNCEYVTQEEIHAIQQNLLHDSFKEKPSDLEHRDYHFVTYEDSMEFIQSAAEFCMLNVL